MQEKDKFYGNQQPGGYGAPLPPNAWASQGGSGGGGYYPSAGPSYGGMSPPQQPPPPPGFYVAQGGAPPMQMGGGPAPAPPFYGNDAGAAEANSFFNRDSSMAFSDIKIRHQFIRKVYSIVTLQLAVTTAFIAVIKLIPQVSSFFIVNTWILWLSLIGTVVIMIVLACCESVSRKYPLNLILLAVFTLLESLLVGCISSQYKTDTLLIAAGLTTIVVVGITLFAFQTKIDFTGFGIYLFVFALVLLGFGLFAIIFRSSIMSIIYAALGCVLFSFYLIFDTQLMLGGKHKYAISPEDYILAALNLYVDIINLFLMILRLVSAAKD